MSRPALEETILRLATPVTHAVGLEIWGLELLHGGRPVVRLYVEAPAPASATAQPANASENGDDAAATGTLTGVSIAKCAHVSRLLGLALEVDNVFAGPYVLEVSSPGLSRQFFTLAQMVPYAGHTVELALRDSLPDWPLRKKFRGRLLEVGSSELTLEVEDGAEQTTVESRVTIAWDNVRRAARVHVFAEPQKPGKKRQRDAAPAAHKAKK